MVDYPKDWVEVELGDICSYLNGTSQEKNFTKYGRHKVISLGNYSESGKYLDDGNRINLSSVNKKYLVNSNELCMVLNDKGNGRLVGKVILIDEDNKYVINQRTLKITFEKTKAYPKYMHKLINSRVFRLNLKDIIQGNTQVYINPPMVMKMSINLPTLKEQKVIADTLSTFDEHIENLEKLIEKKKMIRDGAVEDLMSGNTRLEGFDNNWEEKTILSITKDIITGGTPSTNLKEYWGGSIPWLASTEIHQKNIKNATKNISNIGLHNSSAKIAPKYSVLIALAGQGKTRGTAAILGKDMAINQSLAALVCSEDTYYKFLFYAIELNYEALREISSGDGGRGGLNKKLIKYFKINIPSGVKEQQAIASVLSSMDEEIDCLQKEKEKIEKLKQGAMDDLLTGKVRLV